MHLAASAASLAIAVAAGLAGVAALAFVPAPLAAQGPGRELPTFKPVPARSVDASVPWAHSPWVKGYNSNVRLIAGARSDGAGQRLVAGLDIRLADGWKTYWRHPGDDGGIPPSFDWSGSTNLAAARVLFPAPERLKGVNGYSIGYKRAVVLPIDIEPVDATKPVELVLGLEFGICREICVPAEARLALTVAPDLAVLPPDLAGAMQRVVRAADRRLPGDPALKSASAVLSGPSPYLSFEIAVGSAGPRADLFVEGPDGLYLPMPAKAGEASGGVQRFRIDLKGVDDVKALAGKSLRLSMIGDTGGAEAAWVVK